MARRKRKRHVQLDLLTKDGTRAKTKRAANKRRNRGGRRATGKRSSSSHRRRPAFKPNVPNHVVLRVERAIGNLRRRPIYRAIRAASIVAARLPDVRIIHISIQRTHIHLLVEAQNRLALAKGMKVFQISAAKHINRAVTKPGQPRRRGRVFSDRYFAEPITSPRQAHRAIGYVLCNWRKHGEHLHPFAQDWLGDPYSTAHLFDGWKERDELGPWPPTYESLVVGKARTWLLTDGWKKHGPISCEMIPSTPIVSRRA